MCLGKQEQAGKLAQLPHLFQSPFTQNKLQWLVPIWAFCCITRGCLHPASHEQASSGHRCCLFISGATKPAFNICVWRQALRAKDYRAFLAIVQPRNKRNNRRNYHLQPWPLDILERWKAREGELQVKERIRSGYLGMGREKEECGEGGREGKAGK